MIRIQTWLFAIYKIDSDLQKFQRSLVVINEGCGVLGKSLKALMSGSHRSRSNRAFPSEPTRSFLWIDLWPRSCLYICQNGYKRRRDLYPLLFDILAFEFSPTLAVNIHDGGQDYRHTVNPYPRFEMPNGTVIGNSTRIWEVYLHWPMYSQCGIWDVRGRGVDVWECIKERESPSAHRFLDLSC